jgi:hypothetical protein
MNDYTEVLARELKRAETQALRPEDWTRQELEAAIGKLTDELRGPMGNAERIMVCSERRELQVRLRNLKEAK